MTEVKKETLTGIKFDKDGLVPAIAQDANDGTVLMMAYMNQESLDLTLGTGTVAMSATSNVVDRAGRCCKHRPVSLIAKPILPLL
jgi:phosphoribosyl-AMP cyclohydrolase